MEDDKKWYDISAIDALDAVYNIIYGKRANGKTWRVCRKILDSYLDPEDPLPSVYIRRLDEMIKPKNIESLFDPHLDYISEKTDGKYNSVYYRNSAFYLCCYKDGLKVEQDPKPFCRCYAINTAETTKGQDVGKIKYIFFDEFITRQFYLANEFILWQNLISSLVRRRDHVKIYMVANTVSKFCPYFREMGLTRIKDQKQGTIDLYTMGVNGTKIAVEYSDAPGGGDNVSKYFCFDNPELEMINTGSWEIALYRHIPAGVGSLKPELTFFIVFDGATLRAGLYILNDMPLLALSRRYKEIRDPEQQIIYSDNLDDPPDPNPLHQSDPACRPTRAHEVIISLIKQHKTYFATNEDGEIFSNWLKWATKGGLKV